MAVFSLIGLELVSAFPLPILPQPGVATKWERLCLIQQIRVLELFHDAEAHVQHWQLSTITLLPGMLAILFLCHASHFQHGLLSTIVPLTGFLGITSCRFPFLLLWFFVTSCACAMHVTTCPSLVLSPCLFAF